MGGSLRREDPGGQLAAFCRAKPGHQGFRRVTWDKNRGAPPRASIPTHGPPPPRPQLLPQGNCGPTARAPSLRRGSPRRSGRGTHGAHHHEGKQARDLQPPHAAPAEKGRPESQPHGALLCAHAQICQTSATFLRPPETCPSEPAFGGLSVAGQKGSQRPTVALPTAWWQATWLGRGGGGRATGTKLTPSACLYWLLAGDAKDQYLKLQIPGP